jgi:CDP-diacylglycerol--serine O-phosphatidyltransferase
MKDSDIDDKQLKSNSRILPISRLFPNMVTLMALCSGMSAMRFALNDKWEYAVAAILIAGFLDAMDGRLARLLNATSSFGAQLDSLSDFLSFGVAPAIVLYVWQWHEMKIRGVGWAFALFYTICCAIRLARFNVDLEDETQSAWKDNFFVGIPSTVGAALVLMPMMVQFHFDITLNPWFIGAYASILAVAMASRIPTFSVKKLKISQEYVSLVMVLIGLLILGLIIETWVTLLIVGVGYIFSIPFSVYSYYKYKKTDSVICDIP